MSKVIKSEDLIGKQFNNLMVSKVIENDCEKGRLLECLCTCGKTITATLGVVKTNKKLCDCQIKLKQLDRIGEKYNMLTIKDIDTTNLKNVIVSCDCGKDKSVLLSSVVLGKIKSCGCLSKSKDVTGEKYGKYTIIENIPPVTYGKTRYKRVKCECECGNVREMCYKDLKNGKIKSCGCLIRDTKLIIKEGMVINNWTILSENINTPHSKSKTRTVNVKCVCGNIRFNRALSPIITGKSKSCGCKGMPPKEKIERVILEIPKSNDDEQWREAHGFEGYFISSKGRVFSSKVNGKYINTEGKTCLEFNINYKSVSFNIARVMYQSFLEVYNEKDYILLFIDDNPKNIVLENLFLAVRDKNGYSWVSGVLGGINKLRSKNGGFRVLEKTINKSDIIKCYIDQQGLSKFLKIPMDLTGNNKMTSVSIDRIDNNKGYISGNISLVTRFENMGRGNTDFDTFTKFCSGLQYKD